MIAKTLKSIPTKQQGVIALVIGLLVLLGSFGKLRVLQSFFNTIMIIVGFGLFFWGLAKSDLIKTITKKLNL